MLVFAGPYIDGCVSPVGEFLKQVAYPGMTPSSPWSIDWQQRLADVLQAHHATSLTEVLSSMPCQPYSAVVERLQGSFAPVQIIIVQFEEAKRAGTIRHAARDCLARFLVELLPQGWGVGERADYDLASALADWTASIEISAGMKECSTAIGKIREKLTAPPGWLPKSPDDPILVSTFDSLWPERD